jgi:hypothetical protein
MKTLLTYLILPIIVIVFGFYYTREKADIRYTLSEKIPIKITSGTPMQSIQQLEVKNVGKSEAKQIQLVVKGKIVSYDLLKYSKADSVKEFSSEGLTEIVYPDLPPQGSFKLLITAVNDGIGKESIAINHSQGKGSEAFSQDTSSSSLIAIGLALIYGLMIVWGFRSVMTDSLESKAGYDSDSVLKRKRKPLYVDTTRWRSIRKRAIESKISRDRERMGRDIQHSQSYVLLNIDRPDYLNEEEWISLIAKASESLSAMISAASMESYSAGQVSDLLNIQRPRHFQDENWDKLTKKVGGILVLMLKKEYFWKEEELLKAIKQRKPDQVPEDAWSDYLKFVEQEYFRILSQTLEIKANSKEAPIRYLEGQNLQAISHEKAEVLRNRAYDLQLRKLSNIVRLKDAEDFLKLDKPSWIMQSDYEFLLERAKNIVNLDVQTRRYNSLAQAFESILNGHPLSPSRPDSLIEDEWYKVTKIEAEIRSCKLEREQLATDQNTVRTLKTKIESQLYVIHNLLGDPGSIDRIEDYNNPFSPGNFKNLKTLSEYLKANAGGTKSAHSELG